MTLSRDETKQFLADTAARSKRILAEQIAAAKVDADARGKQPFDLAKLEAIVDLSRDNKLPPVEERRAQHESAYYLQYPKIMTLAEYAERVVELRRW
jgi:hypothetical protein